MQNLDEVVSSWLNGAEFADGLENPAGPLYIDHADTAVTHAARLDTGVTSASCIQRICACC